jgi:hypothetical protein
MLVWLHFDSEQEVSGVIWVDVDSTVNDHPVRGLRADQLQVLPNGGVRVTDDDGRLWVGDISAADEEGWTQLQQAGS